MLNQFRKREKVLDAVRDLIDMSQKVSDEIDRLAPQRDALIAAATDLLDRYKEEWPEDGTG